MSDPKLHEDLSFPCPDCGTSVIWVGVFPSSNRNAKLLLDTANLDAKGVIPNTVKGGFTITPTYTGGRHKCPEATVGWGADVEVPDPDEPGFDPYDSATAEATDKPPASFYEYLRRNARR